jgi:carboxyl-terminal processing protease
LLNEGVAVADRFLHKNQLIVSHRGRSSPEKPYIARHGNGGHDYPIIVLVNRYSASAAEIVAGALQDHDRAWVLGENTFGKGLVQTVYPLSENTGLALTTAKYYTPSGRLIQRDYSNMSFLDYYNRKNSSLQNPTDVKMTDGGRTVYGGGGITPDEKYSVPKLNRFQIDVLRKQAFFNFTARFFAGRDAKLPKEWDPDQNVENDFHQYLLKEGIQFSEAEYAENHAWLKQQLKREIYITAFSVDDARRLSIQTDPETAKAIEAIPQDRALVESAKKLIVQRTQKAER